MAELKTHSNFESVLNPDDKKLSEDYSKNRVKDIADLATARVNEFSRNRRAGGGGFENFFADFEERTLSAATPWGLADQVRTRTLEIIDGTLYDAENTNNGSSLSILDSQLLTYTGYNTLLRIDNIRNNTLTSLTAVEVCEKALEEAKTGAFEQFEQTKNRQAEIIENRTWFHKFARKALKVATLGAYHLVERKKRQKWFNAAFEKRMKRRFADLERNLASAKKAANTQKERMQGHLKRVLNSTHNPAEKAQLKKELLAAIQNNTGDLDDIDLPSWKNYAGGLGITNPEHKIAFLEAAIELDEVKNDLAAIGISKQKNKEQQEMIESAQKQQELFENSANFEFEKIKTAKGFQDLDTKDVEVPKTTDLVAKIENDLKANGVDLESIYTNGVHNIKKSDLLVDTTRLILLVNAIHGLDASKKLQIKTRQMLLKWIEDMDEKTGGKHEKHDSTEVKKQIEVLKNPSGNGVLKDTADKLNTAKTLSISNVKKNITDFKKDIDSWAENVQKKYAEFLTKKGTENFPNKDFELLKESWDKVMKAREFLLKQADIWVKEKGVYKGNGKNNIELTTYKKDLNKLNGDKNTVGSIAEVEEYLNTKTSPKPLTALAAKNALKLLKRRTKDRNEILSKITSIEKNISSSGLSKKDEIQKYLDDILLVSGIDYKTKITPNKNPNIGNLDERIQQRLRAEEFKDEINKKFISNLAKNDQYETLKGVSEGTKVKLTYKKVGGSKNLDFPSELQNSKKDESFTVIRQDKENKVIHLQNGSRFITITNSAANEDGTEAYKNAIVRPNSGGSYNTRNPMVGGAGEHAIVYNMKIAA